MGELVDSSDMILYTLQQYHGRTAQYLSTLGSKIDIWEVGNEVNGNWTGTRGRGDSEYFWSCFFALGGKIGREQPSTPCVCGCW
jgi:hypothetical protein